jgi:hypothetical protein
MDLNDDDDLMAALSGIAQTVDPVPAQVSELARAAFTLRRLDEELAELIEDSDLELAGVRSTVSEVRLLSFQAGEVVVEVQVSGDSDLLLLGQVAGAGASAGRVRLETAGLDLMTTELDELGAFRFEGVRPGTLRLVVELSDGREVATRWVSA